MSASASRHQRRQYARQAPPRVCPYCPADLTHVFSVDQHIARHLAKAGFTQHEGAAISRNIVR